VSTPPCRPTWRIETGRGFTPPISSAVDRVQLWASVARWTHGRPRGPSLLRSDVLRNRGNLVAERSDPHDVHPDARLNARRSDRGGAYAGAARAWPAEIRGTNEICASSAAARGTARQRQLVEFGEGLPWPNPHFRHRDLGLTARPVQMGSLLRNWYGIAPAQSDGL
jgi:hypothetical protein